MNSRKSAGGTPPSDVLEHEPASGVEPAETLSPALKKTVEDWAEETKANPHLLAGARRLCGWAQGRLLTQQEFETGMERMGTLPMGAEHSKRKEK